MEDSSIKKRKLVLVRETVMPLQREQLLDVHGGKNKPNDDSSKNGNGRFSDSAAASFVVGGSVSAAISFSIAESTSSCSIVSGAASASISGSAATLDHASEKASKPCWIAGSVISASIHYTRKW